MIRTFLKALNDNCFAIEEAARAMNKFSAALPLVEYCYIWPWEIRRYLIDGYTISRHGMRICAMKSRLRDA